MLKFLLQILSEPSIDFHNFLTGGSKADKFVICLVVTMFFIFFKTFSCEFVCNKTVCEIQKNNIFKTFPTSSKINLYEIDHFERDFDFIASSLNILSNSRHNYHRNEDKKRYRIVAVRKNGSKYKFFPTTNKKENADNTVAKLNEAIKDKSKINVKINF